jgi:hypothetical protein
LNELLGPVPICELSEWHLDRTVAAWHISIQLLTSFEFGKAAGAAVFLILLVPLLILIVRSEESEVQRKSLLLAAASLVYDPHTKCPSLSWLQTSGAHLRGFCQKVLRKH